jgi:hypothetical protein
VDLKAGARLRSAVCDAEVVVVRAPSDPVELECGGAPMIAMDGDRSATPAIDPARADGTLMGKRYVLADAGLEVLCTKAGQGSLSVNGANLPQKDSKPLPSSD